MKNKDKKHHESTIGKIIYGFMLFAPLFAIASTCLIYSFNKEVETPSEEVEITYKYETNEVSSVDDLVVGNIYHFTIDFIESSSGFVPFGNCYALYNIVNDTNQYELSVFRIEDNLFDFYVGDNSFIANYNGNISYLLFLNTVGLEFEFDFVYGGYKNTGIINHIDKISASEFNIIEDVEITEANVNVEKVFYRAVEYVENSNMFNWAKNSLIYTGLVDTCLILSINNTFIPMLLAYWLIISVLYFLYDIVLMILQVLHRKIHELQETI